MNINMISKHSDYNLRKIFDREDHIFLFRGENVLFIIFSEHWLRHIW